MFLETLAVKLCRILVFPFPMTSIPSRNPGFAAMALSAFLRQMTKQDKRKRWRDVVLGSSKKQIVSACMMQAMIEKSNERHGRTLTGAMSRSWARLVFVLVPFSAIRRRRKAPQPRAS
ncbi:hypothetical protein BDP81DRAFT_166229 [Colletotrichum phormii]|uniref:Uncharacterized protein n=1 Tax=Colletotrichum phormii TaxID=359342 RepID=A0AAI9ZYP5_9PEZI|nr:uncharacterized protein BDP81DRAFT_166229 [Colletotrichum phormii]KAK1640633.1 hypothetical protein BDP81DRAFT_166229 [Colletotrichum phormii]